MLESFFENGERPNDETAEDSEMANKKKVAFKRKYHECYLNYGFLTTGEAHSPSPFCALGGDQPSNKAMQHSKLLRHMETKHAALRDKPLEFSKRKT